MNNFINQLFALNWSGFDDILKLGIESLPKIFWAIVLLLFTRIVAESIQQFSRRVFSKIEPTLQKFLLQVVKILVWIVGGVSALNLVGIQTTTLVAIVGAAGLAVGLALQSSLSHLAAGIMLISFRPFEVGDVIEGGGISGSVDSIGLFSTAIVTGDNIRITVPNNILTSTPLKNFTVMGTRRLEVKVDIGDRPLRSTLQTLTQIFEHHPKVLTTPKPTSQLMSLTQSGKTIVILQSWCQVEDYGGVRSELMIRIKEYLG